MTKEEAIKWLGNLKSDIGQMQFCALWDYGQAIDEIIKLLQAETEWVPVSERLPEVGQDVLFCDGKWTEEGCMMEDGDWCQFRWSTVLGKRKVTAWMPLPKPYKGGAE